MKIKPIYIYLTALVLIVVTILIFDSQDTTSKNDSTQMQQSQMPNDDIHQNLGGAPGSGNVSGEFREKMNRLKKDYESNPADTANAKEYARLLAAAHKPYEAIPIYEQILKSYPQRNDIRLELATVYYNKKDFLKAKQEMEIVYENQPNSPDIQYNLGAAEAALGNNEKAKSMWQDVVEKYPGTEAAQIASNSLQSLR